ncbi:MAG TPA: hypothetical protein VKQ34_00045 [Candidatus Saccharimonadales bacterium]|nr:hypothetical protein [Candidatus Saccharimonadales bacterium]
MLKELLLFIKYPYTAGVIATIWLASAILMAINRGLNGVTIVIINTLVSVVIAGIGFSGRES